VVRTPFRRLWRPAAVPTGAAASGLGLAVAVGNAAQICPDFQAARLDPIEAHRYE
jgi:hypothetical protein